ncbi:MAG: hypothetical protein GX046_02870 [Tissierellia bacterium]|nr:hypothetical protein [Tissierellia bacterium]
MGLYLEVEINTRELLRPRELVIVLARRGGYLYLDYEKKAMALYLRFFEEELNFLEDATEGAMEILANKGLCYKQLEYLGPLFPHHGQYDKIYVFLASDVESCRAQSFLSLSLSEVLEATKAGLFIGSRCDRALGLYLNHLRREGITE